jgi:hypothetical protein
MAEWLKRLCLVVISANVDKYLRSNGFEPYRLDPR